MRVRIGQAVSGAELAEVGTLFRAYADSLEVDLAYQGFAAELASLPGPYAPPGGALLLARDEAAAPIGCAALRPLGPGCCEMKRLYVAPAGRGQGVGRGLLDAILAAAVRLGYREIKLDTLPGMAGAQAMYARAGFRPVPAYYASTVPGTLYLGRSLP